MEFTQPTIEIHGGYRGARSLIQQMASTGTRQKKREKSVLLHQAEINEHLDWRLFIGPRVNRQSSFQELHDTV